METSGIKEVGEYGIWLSPRGVFHTLRMCRHHGLREFAYSLCNGTVHWKCLDCSRLGASRQNKTEMHNGISTSIIPGCTNYVGIHIAEQVLKKAFDVMIRAPIGAPFDFYCRHGLKIDSKCSNLVMNNGKIGWHWRFGIKRNKVPEFFCCIALDNLPSNVSDDPKPKYVWLIPGDAIIDGRVVNDRLQLTVSPSTISKLNCYRRMDMEGKIIKCCDKLKGEKTDD